MTKKTVALPASTTFTERLTQATLKSGLSMIPAGFIAAEIFDYIINEPASKRRDEWMENIGKRLKQLEDLSSEPLIDKLKDDDAFVTTLLEASRIAIRNHQREKIKALANAVMNAALGNVPDDTERAMMLRLIDRCTPAHLSILSVMRAPRQNAAVMQRLGNVSMGGLSVVLFAVLPDFQGRKPLIEIIWKELIADGLVNDSNLNTTMSGNGLLEKRTTDFGDRFLDFITDPLSRSEHLAP
jgi:hypothetical protein